MFVLMSKKAAAARALPPPTNSAAQSSSRTQNACDPCRIRKSKCDGHVPCGRCRTKQIVCTSSRRFAKASGPITEEHVAILQEQQRRLTRAISNMADIIKQAASHGFSGLGDMSTSLTGSELSPFELAEILQRFAPDSQMPETATSPVVGSHLPLKKRRFHENALPKQQVLDVQMEVGDATQTNDQGLEPFQKFLTTVQQHNGNGLNPTASNFQPSLPAFEAQQLQALPTTDWQKMSFAEPMGDPSFDIHPQLAPFVDMVDWDASLEHFLNSQCSEANPDWATINPDLGLQNGASR
ncbi:hypothetical protein M409DRAFT_38103 [Zasmidium cellare ATCC 36951]|uniref:Zn(2)-C6 fungal-type domain-containing protein n=1 Tax=Zasmidium cellare ATCC 36951 TaxID=1080233 RepID=A0A6A6BW20_ZASCE|nr:uncharacterized protein M409DRAFT_38103 [Zasmidium cellare ATCC 36951]KAF2158763.1 hypothetical protein M409DRAFT_38103 [Zasmidium cellare ATCC 36951]